MFIDVKKRASERTFKKQRKINIIWDKSLHLLKALFADMEMEDLNKNPTSYYATIKSFIRTHIGIVARKGNVPK